MRLTTFTDYSLRVLMYLAAAPERRATIPEIARAFRISDNHLVKVVHFLGREGLLENTRGRRGGVRLARAPADINVALVVGLAEGGDRPAECFDCAAHACVLAGACHLQGILGEALARFYGELARYSIADLPLPPGKRRALFQLRDLRAPA